MKCSQHLPQRNLKNNIRVTVHCLPNCESTVKKVFLNILRDYCERFKVECTKEKYKVQICFVEYNINVGDAGLTVHSEDHKKILIQLRDPFLNGWEDNQWTMDTFVTVLCHEIVHACQYLTGRKGFRIPRGKYDKKDKVESYFFNPLEVEARALAGFYTVKYGQELI